MAPVHVIGCSPFVCCSPLGHPVQEKESILKFLALMAVEPGQQLPSRVVS